MRPNIIFYFSDQQRSDTVTEKIMPTLCDLAKEGTRFENSFTCQPVCGPARACLQSGVYATQCGCFKNGIALPQNIKTLADYFNDAGYETAYVGKWHLASDPVPGVGVHCEKTAVPKDRQGGYRDWWRASDILEFTSHGYDGYVFDGDGNRVDFKGYRADCITDFALQYIDQKTSEKPFFLFLSHIEPHHQNDHGRFEGPKELVPAFLNTPIPEDLSFLRGDYEKMYPDYLACIRSLDDNLKRLVIKLKEKGLFENTVIVYTSDHGCHFKTRNLEYKRSCHDSAIHTPLVILGGPFRGGGVQSQLVSLIDLPPTLLDLAGIPVPESYMGKSLVQELKTGEERDCVFLQISESQCGRAIRTKKFTYSVRSAALTGFVKSYANVYFEDYLYDNEKDPAQKRNLIRDKSYKTVRRDLRQMLLREIAEVEQKTPKILPAVIVRKK